MTGKIKCHRNLNKSLKLSFYIFAITLGSSSLLLTPSRAVAAGSELTKGHAQNHFNGLMKAGDDERAAGHPLDAMNHYKAAKIHAEKMASHEGLSAAEKGPWHANVSRAGGRWSATRGDKLKIVK